MYRVEIDGEDKEVIAASLAECANRIRNLGKVRVRIWSPSWVLLIDTSYGDDYHLLQR